MLLYFVIMKSKLILSLDSYTSLDPLHNKLSIYFSGKAEGQVSFLIKLIEYYFCNNWVNGGSNDIWA